MAALNLELTTTPGKVSAKVNYYEEATGRDYDPVLNNPNPVVIQDDQEWRVDLEDLKQAGAIFGAFGGNTWVFKVIFEQLGQQELDPGYKQITFPVITKTPHTYVTQSVRFAPGEIPAGEYKVYATLKMMDGNGLSPISGAGELTQSGTLLQIHNA